MEVLGGRRFLMSKVQIRRYRGTSLIRNLVPQVSILTMSLCASHAYRCPLHRPPGTSTLPGAPIPKP